MMRQRLHTHTMLNVLLCGSAALVGCNKQPDQQAEPTPQEPAIKQPADTTTLEPAALPEDMPRSFTDHVLYYDGEQVPFDMVLIPGTADGSIRPFYIARTEVSWKMFMRWMYAEDLDTAVETAELIKKDLRPTPMIEEFPALHLGRAGGKDWIKQPATGMSWRTAQAYCIWLSEQTGRRYRLPTDAEWMYVLSLSGGVPSDREALLKQAAFADNTEMDDFEVWNIPRQVDEGERNKLGLVNLLGNAAEWVEPQGDQRWVRGGHFMLKADAFTNEWKAIEDQNIWNETYGQLPPSRFWYIDHFYQGLRLVCEVPAGDVPTDALPAGKPDRSR